MSNIKFYTEEQVRKIYDLSFSNLDQDGSCIIDEDEYFKQILKTLTPIELPSDEEMANASNHCKDSQVKVGFLRGVLWYQEQILNQNK